MSAGVASRPSFPRSAVPGKCGACGDELEIRRGASGEIRSVLHKTTGTLRCPPTTRTCDVCHEDGLVECSEPKCSMVGHPGSCLMQCSCCGSWGCPAHVSTVDFLCTSCAEHGAQPFDHDGAAS